MGFEIKNIVFTGFNGFVAKANITVGDVDINGVKLIRQKDGTYFLGMPSLKTISKEKTQHINMCSIHNTETRKAVTNKFIAMYELWCS